MKKFHFVRCLFLACCIASGACFGCSDDNDDAPAPLSKTEVWQALCNQLKTCAANLHEQIGGDAGCVNSVSVLLFGDASCPPETYNGEAAVSCVSGVEQLTCEQFTQSIMALSAGGETLFPAVCDTICPTAQQTTPK